MNSPANIIWQFLLDEGLGMSTHVAWRTYVGFFPTDPNEAICVYDTPGKQDGRIMRTGEQIIHPGIQIQVRGIEYLVAWKKAQAIALRLDAVQREIIATESDVFYTLHNVSRTGDIMHLGVEDVGNKRRHMFAINAVLTIAQGLEVDMKQVLAGAFADPNGNIIPEDPALAAVYYQIGFSSQLWTWQTATLTWEEFI